MMFLYSEVGLYLYQSTIRSCAEDVWVGACHCYLDILGKLQERVYSSVGPALAASFEPLAYRGDGTSITVVSKY